MGEKWTDTFRTDLVQNCYIVAVHMVQNCDVNDIISAQENLLVPVSGEDVKERSCDSLVMCIVTTLNQGLRNGGGIGDILRAPSSTVSSRYEH
jgi:hypothetical protein